MYPESNLRTSSPSAVLIEKEKCWLCRSEDLYCFKASSLKHPPKPEDFKISNYDYGVTGQIKECRSCGFMQCSEFKDVHHFYEDMEDPSYWIHIEAHSLQARKLLRQIVKIKNQGRLLDIGAASGILVEEARKLGFNAEGVEPSKYLQRIAVKRGLPVHLGSFPYTKTSGPFDVITLTDVIEHVPNPVEILKNIREILAPEGIVVVATPNVNSFFARLLGKYWWHYRTAHIGYFNLKTLLFSAELAGLKPVVIKKPGWYFNLDYLFVRLMSYFPRPFQFSPPEFLKKFIIPVNLYDSIMIIFKKR